MEIMFVSWKRLMLSLEGQRCGISLPNIVVPSGLESCTLEKLHSGPAR